MSDKICIKINNKKFNKENEKTKEAINKALNKLCETILQFEENGQPFERIFNNESIKYDVFENNFYTYKFRYSDNTQLRLLYHFVRDKDKIIIELHQYAVKRRNNKNYIEAFEKYAKNYKK
ncbi:hypothetical protein [Intestinibacter sp.]|uniref:hypothetical protein n=1 Tax=Intestinibacter sp. TaxID=1965304 RepID=UPI002A90A533|nr:hypothetical protein [Intestinibacter sp.]MDY5211477.1 hypothetical protein [Intestinibacter sp.]